MTPDVTQSATGEHYDTTPSSNIGEHHDTSCAGEHHDTTLRNDISEHYDTTLRMMLETL